MLLKSGRQLRNFAFESCPFHLARYRFGRVKRCWLGASAASALAFPDTDPTSTPVVMSPALAPAPVEQANILLANNYTHIQDIFTHHRSALSAAELSVLWVRLAKISKDPAERLSPELQKFVDIMACATIERMQQLTPGNLCSVIWAASKLKKGVAQSGMFKSFLKAWAAELEAHLEVLDLDQLRKVMAAVTRVDFAPCAAWKLKLEAALTARLSPYSSLSSSSSSGGVSALSPCAKTLACCLVSAASLGFGLYHNHYHNQHHHHPHNRHHDNHNDQSGGGGAAGFREAAAAACAAAFAPGAVLALAQGPAVAAGGAQAVGSVSGGGESVQEREAAAAAARYACSSLWAAAVLGVPLGAGTIQVMLSHVTAASAVSGPESPPTAANSGARAGSAAGGLTPLDYAQVFWALSKLRYIPSESELSRLLAGTAVLLPRAQPELLATIMWGLADLEVVPPDSWLQLTYSSFEAQLDGAAAEPLQALLHAAATLQLPAPQWSGRLMERLQDVDLRPLPDGNVVDLVMSMHALHLHPPSQLAHRLQHECIKRLALRNAAAAATAAGGSGGGAGPAAAAAP